MSDVSARSGIHRDLDGRRVAQCVELVDALCLLHEHYLFDILDLSVYFPAQSGERCVA